MTSPGPGVIYGIAWAVAAWCVGVLGVGFAWAQDGDDPAVQLRLRPTVVVAVQGMPSARYAGLIVAAEPGGAFERAGFGEIELQWMAERGAALAALRAGQADFAVAELLDALLIRADGAAVVNIAQLEPVSGRMLVARADLGVQSVHDLAGRRVGLWDEPERVCYEVLFSAASVEPLVMRRGQSVTPLVHGAFEAMGLGSADEYHRVLESGLASEQLAVLPLSEAGVDLPGLGLYAREASRAAKPEVCEKFARGLMDGWKDALEGESDALGLVVRACDEAGRLTNRSRERATLRWAARVHASNGDGKQPRVDAYGRLSREAYARAVSLGSRAAASGTALPAYDAMMQPVLADPLPAPVKASVTSPEQAAPKGASAQMKDYSDAGAAEAANAKATMQPVTAGADDSSSATSAQQAAPEGAQ